MDSEDLISGVNAVNYCESVVSIAGLLTSVLDAG